MPELLSTATEDERNTPEFDCDDGMVLSYFILMPCSISLVLWTPFYLFTVLQIMGCRVHTSLEDAVTSVPLLKDSIRLSILSFESSAISISERLIKSTLVVGPLRFQIQLSTVLVSESESDQCCCSVRIEGDVSYSLQAPLPSPSSPSSVPSSWIGSDLTAESFTDLTRKGKEYLQRITDLLHQNILRSNRRLAIRNSWLAPYFIMMIFTSFFFLLSP